VIYPPFIADLGISLRGKRKILRVLGSIFARCDRAPDGKMVE
jgi:hypothetical protein